MPLRLLRNEKALGPAAARNLGAREGVGAYVAFLDDDDAWHPTKLSEVYNCLTQCPDVDVLFHRSSWEMESQDSSVSGCQRLDNAPRWVLLNQPPHVSGVVVRRSSHLAVGFDESFPAAADLDYLLRLFERGSVVTLNRILTIHARADSRLSAISIERRIAGRLALRTKHSHYFTDPDVEAFFLARLAHQYRRAGMRTKAFTTAAQSLRRRPTSLAFRALIATLLPEGTTYREARYDRNI